MAWLVLCGLGSGGRRWRVKQLVSGRLSERERDLENTEEGWRDACKVRTLRKDK